VDDLNNNGVTNTPNPSNDVNNQPPVDYNSMQPQSNPLGVLPVDTTSGSTQPDMAAQNMMPSMGETPNQMAESVLETANPVMPEQSQADFASQYMDAGQVMPDPVPTVDTPPVVESTPNIDTAPSAYTTPVTEPTPVVDSMPTMNTMPTVEQTPVMDTAQQMDTMPTVEPSPVMEASQPVDTMNTMEQAPVVDVAPSMDTMQSVDQVNTMESAPTVPTMDAAPQMDTFATASVENPVDQNAAPAFPTTPDMSSSLSQPLNTVSEATVPPAETPVENEVISALGEKKEEGKDSSVVIIVLIAIIVLLLAGIGYFGYKIFLG